MKKFVKLAVAALIAVAAYSCGFFNGLSLCLAANAKTTMNENGEHAPLLDIEIFEKLFKSGRLGGIALIVSMINFVKHPLRAIIAAGAMTYKPLENFLVTKVEE